ncbi:MAG TPA: PAS domain-containing protein [Parafilimonas sp.]|nr:PAS domain-containing protein [Parafilimonas sp.]
MNASGENLLVVPASDKTLEESALEYLQFKYFPAYARFLLENNVQQLVEEQLRLSRILNLPLLKFFESSGEAEMIKLGTETLTELLEYCADNRAKEYITLSLKRWIANQLPVVTRHQVVAEDITTLSLVRRRSFRHMLPLYTSDLDLYINVMDELDRFTAELDSLSFKTLLSINKDISEQVQALGHIGNWQWDLRTHRLSWSNELYRIYELEPESSITSEKIASYNHPEDGERVNNIMQLSQETCSPHDFYYRIILKDQKIKILHARGQVRLDDNGEPFEMFGTLQDVTSQKLNEEELSEKTKFIQKITDVTPCLIAVYNVKTGKYAFINNALQTLLGYDSRIALEKGIEFFLEIIHPDDLQTITEKNSRALQAADNQAPGSPEPVVDFKYRLRHANGEYRWFHTFGTIFGRGSENEVEDLINISIDVTEEYFLSQQLAEKNAQLKRSEERYHRMISEVEDYAILLLDKDGFVQNWNKGAEKIKGYRADEIIGKNFRVFYRKQDQRRKLPEKLISEAVTTGKASHEGWRVRKDGTKFWGSIVITALHNEAGDIIGFSKVTRDLTERKFHDDRLKEYANRIEKNNEELQKINKELDSFAYVASHDLQEPLRKIRTFCNFILSKGKEQLPRDTVDYFDRITAAAERMQRLIEALLNYSRTNTMQIIYEATDLNVTISQVQRNLAEMIAEKNATIEFSNLPTIQAVPLQFQQLFSNIIENSLKYSRENVPPVIKISATLVPGKNHPFTKSKQCYEITVADNGIGFEQEYAENIFKLFQRLHGRNEYYGTGIGLAICKKIVENHKGTIKATGFPGAGAIFTIILPAN